MFAQELSRVALSRYWTENNAITYDAFGGDLTYHNSLVTVRCRLPQGLADESRPDWHIGSITFASLPGVMCYFSYRLLYDTLLDGLGTPASAGLRAFLRDGWVSIGNFSAHISRAEQEQLCAGMDAVLSAYRRCLARLWTLLGVWEFRPVMRWSCGLALELYLTKDWVRKDTSPGLKHTLASQPPM